MCLSDLKIGKSGRVLFLDLEPQKKRRLMEMGLIPGERITMERKTFGGDPLVVRFRGYRLILARADAEKILVEEVTENG